MSSFLPVPNRVAFTVFGIDIMWYGLLISLGAILAAAQGYLRAPKHGLSSDRMLDIAITCLPAGIVGARAYYVFFQWDYYSQHLSEILALRNGGLAIHGGLIFGIGTALILFRFVWKESFLPWADLVIPGIALAQSIGRWGNYFNSEAHGGPTDLPWAIEVDGQMVHPTFLYESIWCFLLFLFLLWFDEKGKKTFDGQLLSLYMMLYSVERVFVEGLRTDSLMIGPFRQAQVISACFIVLGAALYIILKKRSMKTKS